MFLLAPCGLVLICLRLVLVVCWWGACLDLLVVLGLVSVYLCFILFGFVYFLWLLTLFERLFRVCCLLRFLWVNNVVVTGSLRYGFVWLLTFVLGFDSVVCVCYLGLSCARCWRFAVVVAVATLFVVC